MFRFIAIFLGMLIALFTIELLQPVQQHVIIPFTGSLAHVAVWIMREMHAAAMVRGSGQA